MQKRFSKETLVAIRNDIPIELVISKLKLPIKEADGILRFLCPVCREFQTGTNPKTNLSRCFRCARNFNTIELVMQERKLSFTQSVDKLQILLKLMSNSHQSFKENNPRSVELKTLHGTRVSVSLSLRNQTIIHQ